MELFVTSNPDVLGGESVFAGTRVPMRSWFEHRFQRNALEEFLKGFPTVRREQLLEFAGGSVKDYWEESPWKKLLATGGGQLKAAPREAFEPVAKGVRVLLDENLDWRLRRALLGHDVASVSLLEWRGMQDHALLKRAAEAGFQVLVTMDGKMVRKPNIARPDIALVALRAYTSCLVNAERCMPELRERLGKFQPGTLTWLPLNT